MGRLGEGIMDVLSEAVYFSHGILNEEEPFPIWCVLQISLEL